ncbi:hypothetical protein DCS32_06145 [Dokdonia sp. Dokd-P16]|uniref:hypothetical protein n=1 Tax=Dokdonia sp. Dokd-P16 TaxID=2173169 RepID=UPI000D543C5B|nr:hypothetical protein [Dokdonia sp. Dokd-P16]AWH73750.1 hypothetical protein DCS32_06145 [Dokdonia sp. Dokd-P16]
MAFEKLTNNLKGLTDNGQEYAKVTAEYYKLSLFKNGMRGLVSGANLALRATFGLIAMMFFSIGLSIVIGESLDSLSAGFFIVGGIYLVIFFLIFLFAAKPLETMLLKKYSKLAFSEDSISKASPLAPVVTNKADTNERI